MKRAGSRGDSGLAKVMTVLALMLSGLLPGMSLAAYAATAHNITINSAQHGTMTASVNSSAVTSAEEGTTVTLTGNPDNGYTLNSISGTYKAYPSETISSSAETVSGTNFTVTATQFGSNTWWLHGSGAITITSSSVNILKVELNRKETGTWFNISKLSTDHGELSLSGTGVIVKGVNGKSVTITGPSGGFGDGCRINWVKVYYDGTPVDETLSISGTNDANVKTFVMPEVATGNVSITAEFAELPKYDVTITAGNNMTKTTASGAASQMNLFSAMTDVVYTANSGCYFPEDYSVSPVNGISVTRNSTDQITVSGTPTANTDITLTDAVDVVALINALPAAEDITKANKEAITAARAAYEAMSEEQKAEVGADVLAKLTAAENALGYFVMVDDGTETPAWEATPAEAMTKGVKKGTKVTLKYTGDRIVKSVTASSDGASGNVPVESIELNERQKINIIGSNYRKLYVFRVLPINATDKSVTWSVDGTHITKMIEGADGSFTIRGNSQGTGWVKATANDGSGVSVTLEVEFKPY